jgi:AraC family transcriptional regulator
VSKRQAEWGGVKLAHYQFKDGVLAEHTQPEHLVTVALAGGCNGEIRTASGMLARNQERGSVCIVPSGLPYSARVSETSEHLAMFVDPAHLERVAYEAQLPSHAEVIEGCAPGDPVIQQIALALLAEMDQPGAGGRLYAESLTNLLAIHMLRHYTAARGLGPIRKTGGLSGKKLKRVEEFIAENFDRDLSLDELAQVAGISTFHFAREFKRATGSSPHQYLITHRVERAKAMLADNELPLVEVGFRSGFAHQSHFTRLFRRLTGTTPNSYRLMLQN